MINVQKIATPIHMTLRKEIKALQSLHGLGLAHPIIAKDKFSKSLLIGADYYWSIIGNETIRGDEPTAVKSRIGYLMSGSVETKNGRSSTKQSAMMKTVTDHRAVVCNFENMLCINSFELKEAIT